MRVTVGTFRRGLIPYVISSRRRGHRVRPLPFRLAPPTHCWTGTSSRRFACSPWARLLSVATLPPAPGSHRLPKRLPRMRRQQNVRRQRSQSQCRLLHRRRCPRVTPVSVLRLIRQRDLRTPRNQDPANSRQRLRGNPNLRRRGPQHRPLPRSGRQLRSRRRHNR
jgi:hypothetical protein